MADVNPPKRRAYHSPKRAQSALNTRRRIRHAAQRLFLRDGYLPTTMANIAAEAGVAEKTLYLAFPTKAELLNEIILVGVRGSDDPTPLTQGPEWHATNQSASIDELIDHAAADVASLHGRVARFLELGEASATIDPQLAALRDRAHENIRSDMRELANTIAPFTPHLDVERLANTLFAFVSNQSPYLRLADECGWSQDQYTRATRAILTALIRDAAD
jgi:AcrR family transcriptional regulator